jgi:hypothetical protein
MLLHVPLLATSCNDELMTTDKENKAATKPPLTPRTANNMCLVALLCAAATCCETISTQYSKTAADYYSKSASVQASHCKPRLPPALDDALTCLHTVTKAISLNPYGESEIHKSSRLFSKRTMPSDNTSWNLSNWPWHCLH